MTSKILELIVHASDEASPVLLDKVGGAVSGLGSIAAGVATGGLALAGAAIVALGAATVGAGIAIFKFSQDTETAMSRFAAQTGTAGAELEGFKDTAQDVYAAGLGESIGDVVEQMSLVHRALGETGEELEDSTRRAMTLAEVFEVDVGESTKWVSSMMASFGITSEEAFDVITKGSQMGLDRMGDLGDTLHEYSGDFDGLGFSAERVLAMLNAGLEEGAYNTDVIADGWREYGIRLMEGGDDMSEVFAGMGMDFEQMQGFIAAGDETWGDYASTIVEGLMGIESEVERNAAGIAIFGTKWEDLGGEVFLASGQAIEGIEGIGGATDAAGEQMATGIMPALERLKRTFLTEFAPLGDMVGEVISDKVIPLLDDAAVWLGENVPTAISWLTDKWTEYWPIIQGNVQDFWTEAEPILKSTVEWLGENVPEAIEWLKETATELSDYWNDSLKPAFEAVWSFTQDNLTPILAGLGAMIAVVVIPAFIAWAAAAITAAGATVAALAPVVLPIIAIGAAVALLVAAWEKDWGGIRTFLTDVWEGTLQPTFESMQTWIEDYLVASFGRLMDVVGWVKGLFVGFEDSLWKTQNALKWVRDWVDAVKTSIDGLDLPDWLIPGSPTPFELGLRGIGNAIKDLPELSFDVGLTSQAGAQRATTAGTVIHNYFGRDSVREDRDILRIADSIADALAIRGVQPAL